MMEDAKTITLKEELWRFLYPRFVPQIAFTVGVGIVVWAIVQLIGQVGQKQEPARTAGRAVFDFVAHLPTSGWLYVAVGLIALLGLVVYWFRIEESKSTAYPTDPTDHEQSGHNEQTHLFVVGELRRRALALRTRAVVFLGSSVLLLLGGVYVTVWVLPIVRSYDINEQIRALLQVKYVGVLDAIREGNHWLFAGAIDAEAEADSGMAGLVVEGRHFLEQHLPWRRLDGTEVEVFEFDADRQRSLIGTRDGALRETADGGRTWTTWTRQDIGLDVAEWVDRAAIGSDGAHLVAGNVGTVRILDGEEWAEPASMNGLRRSRITAFEFEAKGQHRLIGTRDGVVRITTDGGRTWKTWTRQDIGLREAEWVDRAAIGSDGAHLVAGNGGTVRILDGEEWAEPASMDGLRRSRITAFEFEAKGQHGLIGTRDGVVRITTDGGWTWKTWTRQDVGLREAEWAVDALIGSDGVRLLVGDEGTVRIRDDGEWKGLAEVVGGLDDTSVTAIEFGADVLHGLVGTDDGAVHVTADGGCTWTTWTSQEIGLNVFEWVVEAVIDDDGVHLVVGDEGTVRVWDGDSWAALTSSAKWPLVTDVEFFGDGQRELLRVGPVVETKDGGTTWVQSTEVPQADRHEGHIHADSGLLWFLTTEETGNKAFWIRGHDKLGPVIPRFESDESIEAITFDENDKPIVVGSKGTTFIGGRSEIGRGDLVPEEKENANIFAVAAVDGKVFALVKGQEGQTPDSIYVRGEFPDLADDALTLVDALPEGSRLRERLIADIPELASTLGSTDTENRTLIEMIGVDQVHWLRAVATLATIYLVQLFVGLYRYSVRLAAFWDSRADAVLLGARFSDSKLSFDDLIAAMAPDALDFKPPRQPYSLYGRRPRDIGESP